MRLTTLALTLLLGCASPAAADDVAAVVSDLDARFAALGPFRARLERDVDGKRLELTCDVAAGRLLMVVGSTLDLAAPGVTWSWTAGAESCVGLELDPPALLASLDGLADRVHAACDMEPRAGGPFVPALDVRTRSCRLLWRRRSSRALWLEGLAGARVSREGGSVRFDLPSDERVEVDAATGFLRALVRRDPDGALVTLRCLELERLTAFPDVELPPRRLRRPPGLGEVGPLFVTTLGELVERTVLEGKAGREGLRGAHASIAATIAAAVRGRALLDLARSYLDRVDASPDAVASDLARHQAAFRAAVPWPRVDAVVADGLGALRQRITAAAAGLPAERRTMWEELAREVYAPPPGERSTDADGALQEALDALLAAEAR
jgi:hypothetical protein